jgi:exonuclease I
MYWIVLAFSRSVSSSGFKNTVNDGFLSDADRDNISSIRGTPRVTLDLDAIPAK